MTKEENSELEYWVNVIINNSNKLINNLEERLFNCEEIIDKQNQEINVYRDIIDKQERQLEIMDEMEKINIQQKNYLESLIFGCDCKIK